MISVCIGRRIRLLLCRYHIEAIPDKFDTLQYKKRSASQAKGPTLKSKTPKSTRAMQQAQSNVAPGSIAPCRNCSLQVQLKLDMGKELLHEQQKGNNLMKELEAAKQKVELFEKVRQLLLTVAEM